MRYKRDLDSADEELATVAVGTGISHAQHARPDVLH